MSDQEPVAEPVRHPWRSRRGRRLLIGGAAVVALLAGAGGVARAVENHRHHGMWNMQQGVPVTMIEHRADRMLSRVNATPDQQAKVHAIIEAAAHDLEPLHATMGGARAQFANLLAAPQIDRPAIEQLRAERVAAMERATQRISRAAEDAAEVLTPDQRVKLKQMLSDFSQPDHN